MSCRIHVAVQTQDFNAAVLQRQLLDEEHAAGAIATFTGHVRAESNGERLEWMELEQYPGMTHDSLARIAGDAAGRWPVQALGIVHRIGRLYPGEQIVWVGASAGHRQDAFAACEFIMDFLKTRAPLWKKEKRSSGEAWVEARDSDSRQADRW